LKLDLDVLSLSGGEKQRLQLARVMLLDPELYLLDEPTVNLDPLSARRIEETILRLQQAGKTVILTTHNLIQARRVGDRFYFLRDGRLLQEGTAMDIFHFPASLEIAEFSSAENIFYGDVRDIAGSRCLVAGGQTIQVLPDAPLGPSAGIIRPEDILISKNPLASSARNSISGTIRSIERLGILFAVGARCGELPLTSFITPHSLEALDLKLGDRVYLTFKATAIHILPVEP
jgi:tungstate transport system ATP-binding protein